MHYFRIVRLIFSYLLLIGFWLAAYNYPLSIYLIKQAKGQFTVLLHKQTIESYKLNNDLQFQEKLNLSLIETVKRFSVDSLGFKPTHNFTHIYDQKNKPILWVVTASKKYELVPYEWRFPMIGNVSYKGFFSIEQAKKEKAKLMSKGYDAGIRSVSAWSTLGWLNDPLLSSQLNKKTGNFCNLLFHELFHATFYKADRINDNENLANFIAHKATLAYLKNDSVALHEYSQNYSENEKMNAFLNSESKKYKQYLKSIYKQNNRGILKQKYLLGLIKDLKKLGIKSKKRILTTEEEILNEQNAYFIDYMQYNSQQDSLEKAFNKFYKGSIKNMVQSLNQ